MKEVCKYVCIYDYIGHWKEVERTVEARVN